MDFSSDSEEAGSTNHFTFPNTPYIEKPTLKLKPTETPTPVDESDALQRSRSPSPTSFDPHSVTPRASFHTPDSPSLPSLLAHAPFTPSPQAGAKLSVPTKNLFKSFTSAASTSSSPLQTTELALEGLDAEISRSEDNPAIAGIIADIRRLVARDRALQLRIAELIKQQSQQPAQRLQAEIAKRRQMLVELEQAAKRQNEEQCEVDEQIRLLEQELADLRRERAENQTNETNVTSLKDDSAITPLWVLVKCSIIVLAVVFFAELLLRYADSCWDSFRLYAISTGGSRVSLDLNMERPS